MGSRSRLRARRLLAVALAVAAGLTVAPSASASSDPSAGDVRRAQQRADSLARQAAAQGRQVDSARADLLALSERANAALAALAEANAKVQAGERALADARDRLAKAKTRTDRARAGLARYAADAYRSGPADTRMGAWLTLAETGDVQQLAQAIDLLGQVGDERGRVLGEFARAQGEQRRATQAADVAVRRLARARDRRLAAKQQADALVADQRVKVAAYQRRFAATSGAAASARTQAAQVRQAYQDWVARQQALARERARRQALLEAARRAALAAASAAVPAAPVVHVDPTPTCTGGNPSDYPNGQVPPSALCALWEAPGESLGPTAAAAFNAMSKAFYAAYGVPVCVTDSYRSYDEQVQTKASRGSYAATPGYSNHGWGLAVDLCGGVESDGSPANTWMRLNAPRYGFFHPAWAERGGGGPYEPWHWEFSG